MLIVRAPLDPQTFESLYDVYLHWFVCIAPNGKNYFSCRPEELGIHHLFVAHPQVGSSAVGLLIQVVRAA